MVGTIPNGGRPDDHTVVIGKDRAGAPIFAVLVKRTYDIPGNGFLARAECARELVKVDEYYDDGEPDTCTVKYETDLVPYKLATDVVVVGRAHARDGKPV